MEGDIVDVRAAYDKGFDEGYIRGVAWSQDEQTMLERVNLLLRSDNRRLEQEISMLRMAVADMNLRYGGHT